MRFATNIDGALKEIRPKPIQTVDDDGEVINHPASIFELWSDSELSSIGIFRVDTVGLDLNGKRLDSETLEITGTRVVRTCVCVVDQERLIQSVNDRASSLINSHLGTVEDRLALIAKGTILLDVHGPGSTNNDVASLRAIGGWWGAVLFHKADLISQIEAGGTPDIEAGWPTFPS